MLAYESEKQKLFARSRDPSELIFARSQSYDQLRVRSRWPSDVLTRMTSKPYSFWDIADYGSPQGGGRPVMGVGASLRHWGGEGFSTRMGGNWPHGAPCDPETGIFGPRAKI